MAEHQYRILGRIPPTNRPTEQENRFLKLYNDTGLKLQFQNKENLFMIVKDPIWRSLFNSFDQDDITRVQFPTTVDLEVPWSIGLPPGDEQLPSSFQHALCIQLCPHLTRCSDPPGANDMTLCTFSGLCRLHVNDKGLRQHRTSEGIEELVPIFRNPRVEVTWQKREFETIANGTRERQYWRAFQFCANCRAARAVGRCSHWFNALINSPEKIREVATGEKSDLDLQWNVGHEWIGMIYSESILSEDIGNYMTQMI